jgi:RNA polymerase sigma factor (sigma-70 family)
MLRLEVPTAMNPTELKRFHAGANDAFTTVLAALEPMLRRQITRHVGSDHDEADDIYAEVCERIFERRRDYRADGPIAAWAQRICRAICVDHERAATRAKHRVRPFDTPPGISTDLRSDAERTRAAEQFEDLMEAVTNAVNALAPKMRAMMREHWYVGRSPAKIAELFGVTAPGVSTTLARAKIILRSKLQPLIRTRLQTPA